MGYHDSVRAKYIEELCAAINISFERITRIVRNQAGKESTEHGVKINGYNFFHAGAANQYMDVLLGLVRTK